MGKLVMGRAIRRRDSDWGNWNTWVSVGFIDPYYCFTIIMLVQILVLIASVIQEGFETLRML